jgi:acetolactate synthase-1/2/3 large subunit
LPPKPTAGSARTTGPGATTAITGVVGAWIESTPLLVISGQVKRADLLGDSGLRQNGVQEVGIVAMVESVTKYAVTVDDPELIRFHMEKALHLARSGRQGPVWIDVPLDVQASLVEPERLRGFTPDEAATTDTSDLAAGVTKTLARLATAKRPLILAGHGIRLAGAAKNFLALVEACGIPVVTTWNALDLLPGTHPLNVGKPGVVALRAPNFALQNCDLLISVGCRLDNIITAYNPQGFARAADKVVVDIDPAELAKLDLCGQLTAICADAGGFIAEFARQRSNHIFPTWHDWQKTCQSWKQRYPLLEGTPFPSSGPISHYQLADALSEALPEEATIATGSSGLGIEAFYTAFRNKRGQRVFLTSGLGSMGYGLPAAIGACMARDKTKTLLIESDGSLQLNLQEMATIAGLQLPIIMFIMNNNGYASIRNTQRNYFQGRYVATGPDSGLHLPEAQRIAQAFGIAAMQISAIADLPAGLEQALAHPGPLVCEILLQPDEVLWPKVAALPQANGSMLSMPLEDMTPLLTLEQLSSEMLIPLSEASIRARS